MPAEAKDYLGVVLVIRGQEGLPVHNTDQAQEFFHGALGSRMAEGMACIVVVRLGEDSPFEGHAMVVTFSDPSAAYYHGGILQFHSVKDGTEEDIEAR